MKLEEIHSLWDEDANIDLSELANESRKIPQLHAKYTRIYHTERLILKRIEEDFKILKHEKYEFFTQGPTHEQHKKGWELPAKGIILKNEVDRYLEADTDLINLSLKIAVQREKVDLLHSIIHQINNRSFQIKNSIEFLKWSQGSL